MEKKNKVFLGLSIVFAYGLKMSSLIWGIVETIIYLNESDNKIDWWWLGLFLIMALFQRILTQAYDYFFRNKDPDNDRPTKSKFQQRLEELQRKKEPN